MLDYLNGRNAEMGNGYGPRIWATDMGHGYGPRIWATASEKTPVIPAKRDCGRKTPVIPAKAGIHFATVKKQWIPAFAGMTT